MDRPAADLVADGLETITGSSEFLKMGRSKIYELMDRGELPYIRIGRARRIPRRALIEFAAARLAAQRQNGDEAK